MRKVIRLYKTVIKVRVNRLCNFDAHLITTFAVAPLPIGVIVARCCAPAPVWWAKARVVRRVAVDEWKDARSAVAARLVARGRVLPYFGVLIPHASTVALIFKSVEKSPRVAAAYWGIFDDNRLSFLCIFTA